jgi:hypothetical protein
MSIDSLGEQVTRRVANRISRRSLMGRLGAGVVALGAGQVGLVAAQSSRAYADSTIPDSCPCSTCGESTTCSGSGSCPSGTCNAGSWYVCSCGGPALKQYTDCAASCSGGHYCGSDGRPGCYYSTEYGTCGGHSLTYCRAISCTRLGC